MTTKPEVLAMAREAGANIFNEHPNNGGKPIIELTHEQAQRFAALVAAAEREDKNGAYLERNKLVSALSKLFPSGVAKTKIDGWSDDWHGCVYIDLPTGQVSWHFHDSQAYLFEHLTQYKGAWDGHDTPEKYKRLSDLSSAEAAESRNKRMVELLRRMRLELWYCNEQLVKGHGAHEGHTVTAVLAESAELLKEAGK